MIERSLEYPHPKNTKLGDPTRLADEGAETKARQAGGTLPSCPIDGGKR
jgi:hypothetical protein